MSLPKMTLAVLTFIIIAIGSYYIIDYEKNTYKIRKQWAIEREEGIKRQEKLMGKEAEARKTQR